MSDVVHHDWKSNIVKYFRSWKYIFIITTTVFGIGFLSLWIIKYRKGRDDKPRPPISEPTGDDDNNSGSSRNPEEMEERQIKDLLEDLESTATDKHKSALNDILYITNQKKAHRRLDKSHVPEKLMAFLPRAGDDTDLLVILLKSLCNLSASSEKSIRDNLAVGIGDLVNLLAKTSRDDVLEYTLRTLMNLAVDPENENRIREERGIPHIVNILKSHKTTETVLLHTLRLLINLVFNEKNREAIIHEHGFERVVELLETNADRTDIDRETKNQLVIRLARLLGFLSQTKDLSVELFKLAVSEKIAKVFIDLIGKKTDDREMGYLMSSLLVITKKAAQDEYSSVSGPFLDELAKELPRLIVPFTASRQKNVQNLATVLLQSLIDTRPDIEDDVKRLKEDLSHS